MPAIGNHITVLKSVDSSNNYAMQQVHAGMAEHGQVWFALEQTAGKGQRGKVWKGAAAENILMSLVLETTSLTINQQFRLSAAVAVAVRNFFELYAGAVTCIKWPNDLYWGDSKAGGILIENVIGAAACNNPEPPVAPQQHPIALQKNKTANAAPTAVDTETIHTKAGKRSANKAVWKWAVVGIGININQAHFDEDLPNAISLHHITQKKYEMMELVTTLCASLEQQWQLLLAGKWNTIYKTYLQHLYKKDQQVRLRKNNIIMPCTIRGVSTTGKLLIAEDETVAFNFGEVSWEL